MKVVRRHGQWRLAEVETGIYLIFYRSHAEMRLVTEPAYEPGLPQDDLLPVRVVETERDAVALFEQMVDRRDYDYDSLAPGVVALGLLLAGTIFMQWSGWVVTSSLFLVGALISGLGALPVLRATAHALTDGLDAGIDYLAGIDEEGSAESPDD